MDVYAIEPQADTANVRRLSELYLLCSLYFAAFLCCRTRLRRSYLSRRFLSASRARAGSTCTY